MIINKTHSKGELVNIINNYNIDISNPSKYRKIELSALLVEKINLLDKIVPVCNLPFLTLIELKQYLINTNPKKTLTIKQKNNIVMKCKKIKHYCENLYSIKNSLYRDEEELLEDINLIKNYGIIPSVRLAIKKYNNNEKLKDKIQVNIPEYVQRELNYKKTLKVKKQQGLKVRTGKFILYF